MSQQYINGLIDSNLYTLDSAHALLSHLPVDFYTQVQQPYFDSSLGKHLRHIIDHYLCLQRDYEQGVIDYDRRPRSPQLETDKKYAMHTLEKLRDFLVTLKASVLKDTPLQVIMCSDVSIPSGHITLSSWGRELQFLQGHSIHHFAMIAAMLKASGIDIDMNFGMAPSTLVYESSVYEKSVYEKNTCKKTFNVSA
ncbi:MAG: hypothetical protein KTR20_16025 [Cellvibrionaceae bacterium]|nr:hypothetical protein [Cellvibrionaceae bacterium]